MPLERQAWRVVCTAAFCALSSTADASLVFVIGLMPFLVIAGTWNIKAKQHLHGTRCTCGRCGGGGHVRCSGGSDRACPGAFRKAPASVWGPVDPPLHVVYKGCNTADVDCNAIESANLRSVPTVYSPNPCQ